MKKYTNNNPVFSDSITIIEPGDPGYADTVNVATKQLLDNEIVLRDAIGKEKLQQLLPTGETTITFTAEKINENSSINVYASIPGLDYTGITVSGNDITITFEEQEEDVYITVILSDVMV